MFLFLYRYKIRRKLNFKNWTNIIAIFKQKKSSKFIKQFCWRYRFKSNQSINLVTVISSI